MHRRQLRRRAVAVVPEYATTIVEHDQLRCFIRVFHLSGPERGDFGGIFAKLDMCQTKPSTDQTAIAKQTTNVLRMRIGGDVEILRMIIEEQIPDTAANQKRLITGILQTVKDFQCALGYVRPGNVVVGPLYNDGCVVCDVFQKTQFPDRSVCSDYKSPYNSTPAQKAA